MDEPGGTGTVTRWWGTPEWGRAGQAPLRSQTPFVNVSALRLAFAGIPPRILGPFVCGCAARQWAQRASAQADVRGVQRQNLLCCVWDTRVPGSARGCNPRATRGGRRLKAALPKSGGAFCPESQSGCRHVSVDPQHFLRELRKCSAVHSDVRAGGREDGTAAGFTVLRVEHTEISIPDKTSGVSGFARGCNPRPTREGAASKRLRGEPPQQRSLLWFV